MKKIALLSALLAVTSGSAIAETSFAGAYVGIHSGAITTTVDTADYWCYNACNAPGSNTSAFGLGLSAGYNWQIDENFVVGIEADINTGTSNTLDVVWDIELDGAEGAYWKDKLNTLMTLRAKAGFVVNKTMVYVTAGLAAADMDFSSEEYDTSENASYINTASYSGTSTGLTAGFGLEHKFGENLSFKAEYLHTTLDQKYALLLEDGEPENAPGENDDSIHWRPSVSQIKLGLNYSF